MYSSLVFLPKFKTLEDHGFEMPPCLSICLFLSPYLLTVNGTLHNFKWLWHSIKESQRSLSQFSDLRAEDTKVMDVGAIFTQLGLCIRITSCATGKLFTSLFTFSMGGFTVSQPSICWKKFANPVVLNHTYETHRNGTIFLTLYLYFSAA